MIDTTSLLTILGLAAAVWAIIPQMSKLNFRLRVSFFDWIVIFCLILLVHVLVFEDVLYTIGAHYSIGVWRWNFDKNSSIYFILLGLVCYVFVRSKTTKLNRKNISIFEKLFSMLLMTKQYGALAQLLEQHIKTVFVIADQRSVRDKIARMVRPASTLDIVSRIVTGKHQPNGWFKTTFRKPLIVLANKLELNKGPEKIAREIVRKLLASQHLTNYLGIAYPYLCLEILQEPLALRGEFSNAFVQILIEDETSLFYSELKNNHNLTRHHRLFLPDENRLLNFYFRNIESAAKYGVYKSVGEVACQIIEYDQNLIAKYNGRLGYYDEIGKYKCPIFCSIHFFQIMLLEGLHQGIKDHLWLFYFTHFTDKILEQLRPIKDDDSEHEFPSIFHFLLYKIISVNMEWIEEAQYLEDKSSLTFDRNSHNQDNGYIPFSAAKALGQIVVEIISSDKLNDRFKRYMLEVVLGRLARFRSVDGMTQISRILENAIIYRDHGWATSKDYRQELSMHVRKIDSVIRTNINEFDLELVSAIESA